jgi:hypothetical protein
MRRARPRMKAFRLDVPHGVERATLTITMRPAGETDLPALHDIFYANEVRGATLPPRGDVSNDMRHILRTGTMCVAEDGGVPIGFAAAITRGHVTFLTDLFVAPGRQSAGTGRVLLHAVMSGGAPVRCTASSNDPRALALYIGAEMAPLWPHFNLRWIGAPAGRNDTFEDAGKPEALVEVVEAQPGDPEILAWDTRIGGRSRAADHQYWVREQRAVPLWFTRGGNRVGYGYARLGAGTLWLPDACAIGPIGVSDPADAAPCVLAAAAWARERSTTLLIDVPGPHPGLALLLAAGFRIDYVETYVSNETAPYFDPRCYIASGSNLF